MQSSAKDGVVAQSPRIETSKRFKIILVISSSFFNPDYFYKKQTDTELIIHQK
jgi:hypothetical protein